MRRDEKGLFYAGIVVLGKCVLKRKIKISNDIQIGVEIQANGGCKNSYYERSCAQIVEIIFETF
jgi:hypothetical protein